MENVLSRLAMNYKNIRGLYRNDSLFGQQFQTEVFQLVFLNFSASGQGEYIYKEYIFGYFLSGDFPFAEILDIVFCQFGTFVQDDERTYLFSIFFGGYGGHLYIFYPFEVV